MKNLEMTLTVDFPANGQSPWFHLQNGTEKCEDVGNSKIAKNGKPYYAMWKPDYLELGQNLNASVFFNRTREGKIYLNATVTLSQGENRTRYETRKQRDEQLNRNGMDIRRFVFQLQRPLSLEESMQLAASQMESEAKASELVATLRTIPMGDLAEWQKELLASPASAGMVGWMDELPPHIRIELDHHLNNL